MLEVATVIALKKELNARLTEAIREFESQTGCEVTCVSLVRSSDFESEFGLMLAQATVEIGD